MRKKPLIFILLHTDTAKRYGLSLKGHLKLLCNSEHALVGVQQRQKEKTQIAPRAAASESALVTRRKQISSKGAYNIPSDAKTYYRFSNALTVAGAATIMLLLLIEV